MRYQKRYAMVTRRANPDEWEQLAVVAIVYCSVRVLISDEYVTNVLGPRKQSPEQFDRPPIRLLRTTTRTLPGD